ncbi:DUF3180 domain-containing protein [Natronosporangium hydrolyticum]|uniref:DUF3180 domain-containing protein n=1 Tax=Natronosporangium hydrolyticum TaxID=2811111 RepID=A0A895YI64_9ACTN|nr:DUF3180 domain-containing protein [Natronosporangium hydrolyticum]QSB15043.1 DUF3180 domain-containing protein [Natronosporangium hydrolyticum]
MSERPPALRPTQPATLVVAALAAAAVAWLLISNFYQQLPPMVWPPVILIGGIALLEAGAARSLWERIHGRGGLLATRPRGGAPVGRDGRPREPMDPLVVVRFAVLAKASSVGGAIFIGLYAGFLPWLAIESGRLTGARADLPATVGGLVVSVALVAAALWLERACRVPDHDGEPPEPGGRPEDPTDS